MGIVSRGRPLSTRCRATTRSPLRLTRRDRRSQGASDYYPRERGNQSERDASDDVQRGASDLAGLGKLNGRHGQRGEGGVRSKKSDGDEQPRGRRPALPIGRGRRTRQAGKIRSR